MNALSRILKNQNAKTKKAIGGFITAFVIFIFLVAVFWGEANFIGLLFSVGILILTGTGTYFLLRYFHDLPDVF